MSEARNAHLEHNNGDGSRGMGVLELDQECAHSIWWFYYT